MKFINRMKKMVFNKKNIVLIGIFLLSGTELYGDVLPFGLPAFSAWSNSAMGCLMYILGTICSGTGFISYLRHIFSFFICVTAKRILKGKVPDFLLVSSSVLVGGALSLLMLGEGRMIYFGFAFFEAAFSMIFTIIFEKARGVWNDKKRGSTVTEGDFAFVIITLMCLALSFANIECGRVSVSASLMILIGMASGFIHKAPLSGVVNMAAGFFSLIFTPVNSAAVAYLALAGFVAAILKKYGKFAVPLTYMSILPLFSALKVNVTSFYLEDVVVASALFLVIPGKFINMLNVLPDTYNRQESSLIISEKLKSLDETFCSVPVVFFGIDVRSKDSDSKEAASVTIESICRDCVFRGGCSKKAEEALKLMVRENIRAEDVTCVRKRELLTAFKNNLRIFRMEGMLKNYIKEESIALSGQMECIGKTLKALSEEKECKMIRDIVAESEIVTALKKEGIRMKKINAGRNSEGVYGVSMEMISSWEDDLYERIIPGILKGILGFEVVRYGVKGPDIYRVNYTEIPLFRPEKGVAAASSEEISGDSFCLSYTDRKHFSVILSDGMGTGVRARNKSNAAAELATKLLSAGMDLPSSVSMVNSLMLRQGGRDFVTLDIAMIDLETGLVEFTKNASATGYLLKCGGRVQKLESKGNPIGILGSTETEVNKIRMYEGDFLILVSDGVAECFKDGELELEQKIGEFTGGSAQNLSDFILSEAIKSYGKNIKDDTTVITVGCIKKQKSGKATIKGGLIYEKRQESNYTG